MDESLNGSETLTSDKLTRLHKTHRKNAINVYENQFETNSRLDPFFRVYQSDLKDMIDEDFDKISENYEEKKKSDERVVEVAVNQAIITFYTRINEIVERVETEEQFTTNFSILKEDLKKNIEENTEVKDKTVLYTELNKFENNLDKSFREYKSKLLEKKSFVLTQYQNIVNQNKNDYKQVRNWILVVLGFSNIFLISDNRPNARK